MMYLVTRNELRLCVLDPSFARNKVSLAIVALQDSVSSDLPEQR